jgi:hypothetical protein
MSRIRSVASLGRQAGDERGQLQGIDGLGGVRVKACFDRADPVF